jgi:hypothetical protein
MLPLLDAVAVLLEVHPGLDVETTGHTDDVPIATSLYPSNWQRPRSGAGQRHRAAAVPPEHGRAERHSRQRGPVDGSGSLPIGFTEQRREQRDRRMLIEREGRPRTVGRALRSGTVRVPADERCRTSEAGRTQDKKFRDVITCESRSIWHSEKMK